jgi:polysaccharide deacetylase 2 family uncharacterized protein YibQ
MTKEQKNKKKTEIQIFYIPKPMIILISIMIFIIPIIIIITISFENHSIHNTTSITNKDLQNFIKEQKKQSIKEEEKQLIVEDNTSNIIKEKKTLTSKIEIDTKIPSNTFSKDIDSHEEGEIYIEEEIIYQIVKNKPQKFKPDIEDEKIEKPKVITPMIQPNHIARINKSNKPKLAIIVDDIINISQVREIQSINYPLTMSFLPPTSLHRKSAIIAQNIPFYMIHFPLEAKHFRYAEKGTLRTTDSYETILNKVKELHRLFPNATYTNNHTGSKFTTNYKAMNKLMKALKQYNFTFVDSKTASKTVVGQTASENHIQSFTRDVFLDNKKDKEYIQRQISRVVNIAKKNGFAIAICHPYGITLDTLDSSKHLLKDVELVFVNQL